MRFFVRAHLPPEAEPLPRNRNPLGAALRKIPCRLGRSRRREEACGFGSLPLLSEPAKALRPALVKARRTRKGTNDAKSKTSPPTKRRSAAVQRRPGPQRPRPSETHPFAKCIQKTDSDRAAAPQSRPSETDGKYRLKTKIINSRTVLFKPPHPLTPTHAQEASQLPGIPEKR